MTSLSIDERRIDPNPNGPSASRNLSPSGLDALVEAARAHVKSLSPAEIEEMLRIQRRNLQLSQARMGSDADETACRQALAEGDLATLNRLTVEANARETATLTALALLGA